MSKKNLKHAFVGQDSEDPQVKAQQHLTTLGGRWYFWQGSWSSKAQKPGTLSRNPIFTKV